MNSMVVIYSYVHYALQVGRNIYLLIIAFAGCVKPRTSAMNYILLPLRENRCWCSMDLVITNDAQQACHKFIENI